MESILFKRKNTIKTMKKKILTISVAAYNMESYLNRCVDSILIPDLISDIEVIIVNDGSTDNTLEIACHYQELYPDVVKIIDKQNGGYGSATNCAMEVASGLYFKVLDADDWLDKDALKYCINFLNTTDSDLVITNYSKELEISKKSYPIRISGIEYEKNYNFQEFCILDMTGEPRFAMHSITYRTDILQRNNIKVSECYYSDVDYSVYPLTYIKSLVFIDVVLYKYSIGREGQSVSSSGLIQHFEDHLFVCKKLVDYYSEYHSKSDSILSLNIGYNTAAITFHIISIITSYLYSHDKIRAVNELNNFLEYLSNSDDDLYELAKERVYNFSIVK